MSKQQTFSMETGDYIRSLAEKNDSVVRKFSVQLWSVNQRTVEAEEVTDS
jgi:hypothetical protein